MKKRIKYNTKTYIEKCISIHKNKYHYNKTQYKNSSEKITITCPKHGDFNMKPYNHLNGQGCKQCYYESLKTTKDVFLQKSNILHNNKFTYILDNEYVTSNEVVVIICPIHGKFKQKASYHLSGHGCRECFCDLLKITKNEFIRNSNKQHNFKYDYSLVKYINSRSKVKIICPKHGVFEQTPKNHMRGQGCPKCIKNIKRNNNTFIQKSITVHNNKYDYSLVEYVNCKTKVKIICPKHGVFEQIPDNHINKIYGCPKCNESKGEKIIRKYLENNNIDCVQQKIFDGCIYKRNLKFDFYLPDYNTCIEYDGQQHFESIDYFGGIDEFTIAKKRDKIKNIYCKNNNIKLLRIKYDDNIIHKLSEYLDIK